MFSKQPFPVHKPAWIISAVVVFFWGFEFFKRWPISVSSRFFAWLLVVAGSVLLGWLFQLFWGFLASFLPKSSPYRSLKKLVFAWVLRIIYLSVIFAMCDLCALSIRKEPMFSYESCETGNGDGFYYGFGYSMLYLRDIDRDGGRTLGPIVWFWFTPFMLDGARGGIKADWVWK